jgi:hypothetical protein
MDGWRRLDFAPQLDHFPVMSKAEIIEELPKLARADRQEILDRLCALQDAEHSGVHQQWMDESLRSGPARPASATEWEGALQNGLSRATKRL